MSYQVGKVHVYVERSQPATRFVDRNGPRPTWFRCSARTPWWTDCCDKRRWAKYVRVQVYFDKIHRFCANGHGCKAEGSTCG
jgi:hypothetical protein